MPINLAIADGIYSHGFQVIDNFLAKDTYQALCSVIRTQYQGGAFKPAKIGQLHQKNTHTTVRNDEIFWLDNQGGCSIIKAYFEALDNVSETLNRSLFLGLIDYEAHFAIYQPNHFYKKHIDQFAATKDRRISCVYYLNEDWQQADGGELLLYDDLDKRISSIRPEGNRFVCFNSDMVHEVSISYRIRYSIAAWLKNRPR